MNGFRPWVLALATALPLAFVPVMRGTILGMPASAHMPMEHAVGAAPPNTLPMVLKGADKPELISDELAYRHLIDALAIPDQASDTRVAARDALLAQIGLSAQENSQLLLSMGDLRGALDAIDAYASTALSSEAADFVRGQRKLELDSARDRINSALGMRGASRLLTFVRANVKPNIVIYGALPPE